MKTFELSASIDKNKIFILNRSKVEKRLDPFYYVPQIAELEEKIKIHNPKPLRSFVVSISSGATPKTTEKEKYYSDEENGIPFLRVQNLLPTGFLELTNCKYINKETHDGYLKRSQVSGGDLLVKITGVGRMAIASVAPDDFVGNTNQHMVVIKTGSKEISTILAAYLNTDIGEKLASRRATGGTRPALDYPALLSIPIIFDKRILEITKKAIISKQQKEAEAEKLLTSIDAYLLNELGITLPKKDNSLQNRIFETKLSKVSGGRFDPNYASKIGFIQNQKWKYPKTIFKDLLFKSPQYGANEEAKNGNPKKDIRYIRITDIDDFGNLKNQNWKTANKVEEQYLLEFNDILFARSGSVGRCYIHKDSDKPAIFAGYLIRFVVNNQMILPNYLFYYCNSIIYKYWVDAIHRPAVQSNINSEEYKSLIIPLPPMDKQTEISEHIKQLREQAKQLQKEAVLVLKIAKQEVEKMILETDKQTE